MLWYYIHICICINICICVYIYLYIYNNLQWAIYNCYVFLMNLSLHHYIVTLFVSCYSFWLKVYFVWNKYSYPCPLLVSIVMKIFFLPFTLNLCMSLKLKWIPCRQHIFGSCFLIHSTTLHLLIGEFNLFTFKVIIVRERLTIPIF